MVDLEKVRIFYHVIKEGSLGEACKILGKGPGTVSKHLSDLEKQLGHKLYIRRHQRFELTEEGQTLFSVAQNTIPSLEKVAAQYESPSPKKSTIILLTTTGVTSIWLIKKVSKFLESNPEVFIRIITTNEDADFKNSKADIGILPKVHSTEGISQKKVLTVYSKLYASPKYLEKNGIPQSLKDLDYHKLIGYYSDIKGIRGDVDWHLTKETKSKSIREPWITVNSAFCQLEAAIEGLGILAIPNVTGFVVDRGLVEVLSKESIPIDVYVMIRAAEIQSDLIKSFVEFLYQ